MRKITKPRVGQYGLATVHSDRDPMDPWVISTVVEVRQFPDGKVYFRVDGGGSRYFKHFWALTPEEGAELLLTYRMQETHHLCRRQDEETPSMDVITIEDHGVMDAVMLSEKTGRPIQVYSDRQKQALLRLAAAIPEPVVARAGAIHPEATRGAPKDDTVFLIRHSACTPDARFSTCLLLDHCFRTRELAEKAIEALREKFPSRLMDNAAIMHYELVEIPIDVALSIM